MEKQASTTDTVTHIHLLPHPFYEYIQSSYHVLGIKKNTILKKLRACPREYTVWQGRKTWQRKYSKVRIISRSSCAGDTQRRE